MANLSQMVMIGSTVPSPEVLGLETLQDENLTLAAENTTHLSGHLASLYNSLPLSQFVYVVLLTIFGIIGNVFSAVVMRRPRFRVMSYSVYMLALAVTDTGYLLYNPINRRLLGHLTGVQLTMLSVAACRLTTAYSQVMSMLSSWLLCAVTVQRVVAVSLPHKAGLWFTVPRAWGFVWALIIVISVTMGTVVFTTQSHVKLNGVAICFHKDHVAGLVFRWVSLLGYSLVPSFVISVCNVVLVTKVVASFRFRQRAGVDVTAEERKMVALTGMIVVTSTVFVLLAMPVQLFIVANLLFDLPGGMGERGYAIYLALRNMQVCNHAVNGYVYCLSGPMFRHELFEMLRCGAGRKTSKPRQHQADGAAVTALSSPPGGATAAP